MTTRAEGTGLGLPIVAKILEDHGGGIELLDAPEGRGAWVRLYFPTERQSARSPAAKRGGARGRRDCEQAETSASRRDREGMPWQAIF